ncbi:MAG: menaquinone-dependent protoporphyrinogen IX dehydrogenase [Epsilonproteobacteria bacterium]|nr:menaquinone-dependent protoporphyrinogen IX dehydrogenase [Campylobacterota bacterium]
MAKILLIFSTTDNHTKKICRTIETTLNKYHHKVTILDIENFIALENFDKIIIGASIRYGKHSPKVYNFITTHQALLESKPNAFFSVNVVARKPEKNHPTTNPYLIKFLKQITWKPQHLAVFGGKLDYQKYGLLDRQMIRFIMWMTKGPTDPKSVVEFTDWKAVEKFAYDISKL